MLRHTSGEAGSLFTPATTVGALVAFAPAGQRMSDELLISLTVKQQHGGGSGETSDPHAERGSPLGFRGREGFHGLSLMRSLGCP